ncbi:MAG: preprotein translocase subunit SecA, partial [Microgenomates group bacterium]
VKYAAVVREIEECYRRGQPVLVGTTSIEKNEIISKFLKRKGIPHQVLNAKHHEKEARIIAEAGRKKAVTVATNMAGRGVDIVLGGAPPQRSSEISNDKFQMTNEYKKWKEEHEEVVKLGGLHVIGTERHESRRIDNQLRGRSGRQGDPGSSRFFVSLEDDLMRIFGGEQISRLMETLKIPEDQPIEHRMVSKAIEQAQIKVEGFNFDLRKRVVEYDDVMNKQREIIYGKRNQVLEKAERGEGLKKEILEKMEQEVKRLVEILEPEVIVKEFCEILPLDSASQGRLKAQVADLKSPDKISELLRKLIFDAYEMREKQVGGEVMREIEKFVYLQAIDRLWIDHLDAMDDLREGVGLRGYAQQDPLVEYKKEAFTSFERLLGAIDEEVIRRIFRVQVSQAPRNLGEVGQTNIPSGTPFRPDVTSGLRRGKKIGRNDPCPCGATKPDGTPKKYKHCCYPQYG